MSSATSTEPNAAAAFRPWHFFVILTLIAATAAVLAARRTTPENLVMLSLTVFAAGAAGIAMYRTLLPLVGRERTLRAETLGHRARTALEREKVLVLRSIKELEFDQAMGKLAQSDFDEMSERLRARAMGLMRQLDATHAAPRERIERELADRVARETRRAGGAAQGGVGSRGAAEAPAICADCGTSNDADARFCKECGTKLARGATHA
jgi:zinc-ribbon domain